MSKEHDQLEPIDPRTAQKLYLGHKETNCADATVRGHHYRTNHFVRWCDEVGIDNLNDLTGRAIHEYRLWRKNEADLSPISMNTQMSTIRVFLKWAASIEAVPTDLHEKVLVPRVSAGDECREEILDAKTAQSILDYLAKYRYASINHIIIALLWETGIRLGTAIAVDLTDVNFDNHSIALVHRPEQGTPLKNGIEGERPVAIRPELTDLLNDFIENNRNDVSDGFGRNPLLTTTKGRITTATFRRLVYQTTAPCFRGKPCEDCVDNRDNKCGMAVSPHSIRRGSITHYLTKDVPIEIVGDRMNVSRRVLKKHYDRRSEDVKLEQRRTYLDNI